MRGAMRSKKILEFVRHLQQIPKLPISRIAGPFNDGQSETSTIAGHISEKVHVAIVSWFFLFFLVFQ